MRWDGRCIVPCTRRRSAHRKPTEKRALAKWEIGDILGAMPADYRIDPKNKRVWSSASGTLTHADLAGHMSRLSKDPQFDPSFSQLIDFRHITKIEVTTEQLIELTETSIFSAASRRALVTLGGVHFGLARMYESYRTAKGDHAIHVFLDFKEAIDWLDSGAAAGSDAVAEAKRSP
jgi:hypothetical protein